MKPVYFGLLLNILLMLPANAQVPTPKSTAASDPWDMSSVSATDIEQLTHRALSWSDLNWLELLNSHWHNRLVHFPIVLICLALVLVWKPLRHHETPDKQDFANTLISGIALLALIAVVSGQQQAAAFASGPMSNFLFWHQLCGILSAVLLLLAMIYINRSTYSHTYLKWGILMITASLVFTGFLGGILASH